jgi:hypothetical protein
MVSVTAQRPAIRHHDSRMARTAPAPQPGDGLLHPVALTAVALLLLNDHLMKPMLPGLLTGKLSDIAGLFAAPLVAVAAIELASAARGRRASPNAGWLVGIAGLIAMAFVAAKTTAAGAAMLGALLGLGQWAGGMALAPLLGAPPPPSRAAVVVDPTDLVALVSVAAALALCLRRHTALSAAGWR